MEAEGNWLQGYYEIERTYGNILFLVIGLKNADSQMLISSAVFHFLIL